MPYMSLLQCFQTRTSRPQLFVVQFHAPDGFGCDPTTVENDADGLGIPGGRAAFPAQTVDALEHETCLPAPDMRLERRRLRGDTPQTEFGPGVETVNDIPERILATRTPRPNGTLNSDSFTSPGIRSIHVLFFGCWLRRAAPEPFHLPFSAIRLAMSGAACWQRPRQLWW